MSSPGHGIPRVRALDGLRGLAVVAVLIFHSDLLVGGYLGVDVFFVLSGYLITAILLVEVQTSGRIALGAFWVRRARRLLPALFLVIVAVAGYAAVFAGPTELGRIRADGFATLGYVANWRSIFAHVDYWELFRRPSPLEHTWSLAIEEQFYVIWPLAMLGVLRWARRRGDVKGFARRAFVVSTGLAAMGAGWALWIWFSDHNATRIYFGTDTRAPAILLGAAAAGWIQWRGAAREVRARRAVEIVGLVGLGFLAFACVRLEGDALFEGGLLASSVAAVAVLIAAANPRPGIVARFLAIKPLVALGLVSYGLYLWHWPIYLVLDASRTGLEGWTLFGVRFAVTLVVAIASYVVVEQPIRKGFGSWTQYRVIVPVIAVALIGLIVVTTSGGYELATEHQVFANPVRQRARAERSGATRIMIAGNSIGNVLGVEGLTKVTTVPPVVVLNDGVFSCDFPTVPLIRTEFLPNPTPPIACDTPWKRAIRGFDPQVVLLILGDIHVTDYNFVDGWATPCEQKFRVNYRRALDDAVRRLSAGGAKVVLTTAAYSRFFASEAFNQGIQRATRCSNTIVRQYAASHRTVGFIDLNRFVCPDGTTCLTQLDGSELRSDGVHYRGRGAQIVAAWMLTKIGIDAHPSP